MIEHHYTHVLTCGIIVLHLTEHMARHFGQEYCLREITENTCGD